MPLTTIHVAVSMIAETMWLLALAPSSWSAENFPPFGQAILDKLTVEMAVNSYLRQGRQCQRRTEKGSLTWTIPNTHAQAGRSGSRPEKASTNALEDGSVPALVRPGRPD